MRGDRQAVSSHRAGVAFPKKAQDSHPCKELVCSSHAEIAKAKPPKALEPCLCEVPEGDSDDLCTGAARNRVLRRVLPEGGILSACRGNVETHGADRRLRSRRRTERSSRSSPCRTPNSVPIVGISSAPRSK